MSRFRSNTTIAMSLVSAFLMLGLVGCSSSTPTPESAALQGTELTFSLNQCQQLGAGLFKCPATDKPICNPDYVGTDVQCVRTDKNGKVIVQQLQMR